MSFVIIAIGALMILFVRKAMTHPDDPDHSMAPPIFQDRPPRARPPLTHLVSL